MAHQDGGAFANEGRQKLKSAANFYENKIKELTNSLKELEAIVQQKQMNVRTIEEGPKSSPRSSMSFANTTMQYCDIK